MDYYLSPSPSPPEENYHITSRAVPAVLKDLPTSSNSFSQVGEAPIGEDAAQMVIEACSSGNNTALQGLLSQPEKTATMFRRADSIYPENRPSQGRDNAHQVTAQPSKHLEQALNTAAESGHAPCVSTILSCAKERGIAASDLVGRILLYRVILRGTAAVLLVLVTAYPDIARIQSHHAHMPFYEAVVRGKTEMAEALLEAGADPWKPFDDDARGIEAYERGGRSLMAFAAYAQGPRMTEMLLQHKIPISGTGALHTAAGRGSLAIMRLLIQHGADVDEIFEEWDCWTPMHCAASEGHSEAMKLLEEHGARLDVEDKKGKTPKQLRDEYQSMR